MKKVIVIILICNFFLIEHVNGQENRLQRLYFESLAYPEKFDSFLSTYQDKLDQNFINCFNQQLSLYQEAGEKQNQQCSHLVGDAYWECIKQNSNAQMYYWMLNVKMAIDNQVNYVDSEYGQSILTHKNLMCQLSGCELWISSVRIGVQNLEFSCP